MESRRLDGVAGKRRRGYEDGSHLEIEVSKLQDWTAFEIYSRTEKLRVFMQEGWNLQFDENQIEAEFGESLNWEYSKPTGQTRSIVIEEKAEVFNPAEQPKIFDWLIDRFDWITTALSMAGERLSLSGDSSDTRFEIRKRCWAYALVQIMRHTVIPAH